MPEFSQFAGLSLCLLAATPLGFLAAWAYRGGEPR
jgi:hypothetical protein